MSIPSTDASPASESQAQDTAAPATDVLPPDANAAESSPAGTTDAKSEEPASLLDVVKNVLEKPAPPEESSTPEADQEQPQADTEATAEEEADGEADVPFHNHPRWKQRTEELKAIRAERDALAEPAKAFESVTSFMREHGLEPNEVAEGFEVMAALKSRSPENLKRVLEWMEPNYKWLREQLGEELPEDLSGKVQDGLLGEDDARELARARANSALAAEARKRQTEAEQAAQVEQSAQAAVRQVVDATNQWEVERRKSDPDYAKKAELVQAQVVALVQKNGKPPSTVQEALALAEEAYATVNKSLKAIVPPPRQISPSPVGMSADVSTAPRNLREAVAQGLARSRQ